MIVFLFIDFTDLMLLYDMNYQTDKSLIGQFQEFDDYRDADDAVYDLNGKDLHGSRCVLIKKYFLEDQFSKTVFDALLLGW